MTHKYIFHNFTDKPFTGYWNGRAYTFKPGTKKYYDRLIARHFAKHLTNQVLIEQGKERATSPKKPDEVPEFMNIFHKAFLVEEVSPEDDLDIGPGVDPDEPSMNIRTQPRQTVDPYDASAAPQAGPAGPPQVIESDAVTEESEYEEEKVDEGGSEG